MTPLVEFDVKIFDFCFIIVGLSSFGELSNNVMVTGVLNNNHVAGVLASVPFLHFHFSWHLATRFAAFQICMVPPIHQSRFNAFS
jgi:hypothetical protein